jgi:hypothetical protein
MSAATTAAGSEAKPPAAVTAIVIDSEIDSGSELSELEGFDSDDGLGGGGGGGGGAKGAEEEEEDEEDEMWESESLLEDALDELTTEHFAPGVYARSRFECARQRLMLRGRGGCGDSRGAEGIESLAEEHRGGGVHCGGHQ